jgi:hypothetical protein
LILPPPLLTLPGKLLFQFVRILYATIYSDLARPQWPIQVKTYGIRGKMFLYQKCIRNFQIALSALQMKKPTDFRYTSGTFLAQF